MSGVFFLGSGGTVTNCTVKGFRSNPLRNRPWDYGVVAVNSVSTGFEPAEVRVLDSTFEDNHFSVVIVGDQEENSHLLRINAAVKGNRVTGFGPSSILGYGIWVNNGVEGEITGNTLINHVYTGDAVNFPAALCAYDNKLDVRSFSPLKPLRFVGNTFSNNTGAILMVGGNNAEIANNTFLRNAPGISSWGAVAASGTNITLARNTFFDLPTGIVLLGRQPFGGGWPETSPAANPRLISNKFFAVPEPVRIGSAVTGILEEGTESYASNEGSPANTGLPATELEGGASGARKLGSP
jgi:hypothetical protein